MHDLIASRRLGSTGNQLETFPRQVDRTEGSHPNNRAMNAISTGPTSLNPDPLVV
jgi:hypothetical protein